MPGGHGAAKVARYGEAPFDVGIANAAEKSGERISKYLKVAVGRVLRERRSAMSISDPDSPSRCYYPESVVQNIVCGFSELRDEEICSCLLSVAKQKDVVSWFHQSLQTCLDPVRGSERLKAYMSRCLVLLYKWDDRSVVPTHWYAHAEKICLAIILRYMWVKTPYQSTSAEAHKVWRERGRHAVKFLNGMAAYMEEECTKEEFLSYVIARFNRSNEKECLWCARMLLALCVDDDEDDLCSECATETGELQHLFLSCEEEMEP